LCDFTQAGQAFGLEFRRAEGANPDGSSDRLRYDTSRAIFAHRAGCG
jgi:hypothetical protein